MPSARRHKVSDQREKSQSRAMALEDLGLAATRPAAWTMASGEDGWRLHRKARPGDNRSSRRRSMLEIGAEAPAFSAQGPPQRDGAPGRPAWPEGPSGSIPRPAPPAERSRVARCATTRTGWTLRVSTSWGSASTASRRTGPSPRSSTSPSACCATSIAVLAWRTGRRRSGGRLRKAHQLRDRRGRSHPPRLPEGGSEHPSGPGAGRSGRQLRRPTSPLNQGVSYDGARGTPPPSGRASAPRRPARLRR